MTLLVVISFSDYVYGDTAIAVAMVLSMVVVRMTDGGDDDDDDDDSDDDDDDVVVIVSSFRVTGRQFYRLKINKFPRGPFKLW